MEKVADLHIHTSFSDGTFTPKEVMEHASERGLNCIAITDHDCIDAIPMALSLQKDYNIEVVPGVEMTAQEDDKELHILGYFIDYQNEELNKALKMICHGREARVYEMADKLKQHGVNVDAGEIVKYANSKAISRLHAARYLVDKGYLPSLKVVFDKYIGDGRPCYVSCFKFSASQVIDSINSAGGVAIIAHPGLNNVMDIFPVLLKSGIEGLEVYYAEHKQSTVEKLVNIAQEHNLLITGGSDCHGTNKKQVLMGNIKLPYQYVERLKEHANCKRK